MKFSLTTVSVRYTEKYSLHMLFGLSIPHMIYPPARSSRQSLRRPRWLRGHLYAALLEDHAVAGAATKAGHVRLLWIGLTPLT